MKQAINKFIKTRVSWSLALSLFALIAIIPFLILCQYVYPINDDFSFALVHIDTNPFQSVYDLYMNWSGRYLATFVSSLNPFVISHNPIPLFRYFSAGIIFLFFIIFLTSPLICCKKWLSTWQCLGLGAFLMLIYIALMPSTSQMFYWFSSYTAYTIPSLFMLVLIALSASHSKICHFFSYVLAFLVPGGNEVTAVLTVCIFAYLSFAYRKPKFYILFGLSLLAIIIVILSPGNSIRMEHQLSSHPYIWALIVSITQSISWIFLWIPLLLLSTLVYIPLFGHKLAQSSIYNISFKYFFIAFWITVILAHIPPTLGLSSVMIDRTANCLLVFFIVGYFFGINILIKKHPDTAIKLTSLFSKKLIMAAVVFCFLFTMPFTINSPVATAVADLVSGKGAQYATIQQERIDLVQNETPEDIIELPSLGTTSKSLFIKELDSIPDGEFSTNFCTIYGSKGNAFVKDVDVSFEDNFTSLKNRGKNARADRNKR